MLEVTNLFVTGTGKVSLLKDVSCELVLGECVGLTGASGSGKTTLIKSIMGVLEDTCQIVSGDITLNGISLSSMSRQTHREMCGTTLGFIPQNPMTAFDRHHSIGKQMIETFKCKLKLSKQESLQLAKESLEKVNLCDTERILAAYPSKLSGGMLQRITMSFLLAMQPQYIFADEPTSALDESNRDLLLSLLKSHLGGCGILFLSHDAVALKRICQRIMVMENGGIIESAATKEIFQAPVGEWTKEFVESAQQEEGANWQWELLK